VCFFPQFFSTSKGKTVKTVDKIRIQYLKAFELKPKWWGKRFLVLHGHEFGPHYQDSKLNVLSGLNFPPQCHALYIVSRKKIPKNTAYIFIFTKTRTLYTTYTHAVLCIFKMWHLKCEVTLYVKWVLNNHPLSEAGSLYRYRLYIAWAAVPGYNLPMFHCSRLTGYDSLI
jgi:hypothetical protein